MIVTCWCCPQELSPANYLKSRERLAYLEPQLSAPSKVKESSSTPQPEEPLQINMPTPTTAAPIPSAAMTPLSAASNATPVVAPLLPQFGYHEINVMSLAGLAPHIAICDQVSASVFFGRFYISKKIKSCKIVLYKFIFVA